jgi:hypothetical protein
MSHETELSNPHSYATAETLANSSLPKVIKDVPRRLFEHDNEKKGEGDRSECVTKGSVMRRFILHRTAGIL